MDNSANYEVFRECLSNSIVEKSEPKPSKTAKKRHKSKLPPKPSSPEPDTNYPPRTNPEELAEFTDVRTRPTNRPKKPPTGLPTNSPPVPRVGNIFLPPPPAPIPQLLVHPTQPCPINHLHRTSPRCNSRINHLPSPPNSNRHSLHLRPDSRPRKP